MAVAGCAAHSSAHLPSSSHHSQECPFVRQLDSFHPRLWIKVCQSRKEGKAAELRGAGLHGGGRVKAGRQRQRVAAAPGPTYPSSGLVSCVYCSGKYTYSIGKRLSLNITIAASHQGPFCKGLLFLHVWAKNYDPITANHINKWVIK